jgi:hypothetical protein
MLELIMFSDLSGHSLIPALPPLRVDAVLDLMLLHQPHVFLIDDLLPRVVPRNLALLIDPVRKKRETRN